MLVDHESVGNAVRTAVETATSDLRLRHEGPEGLRGLLRRAREDRSRRGVRRLRTWIVTGLVGGLLLAGGAAAAREIYLDRTEDVFRDLHPDKRDAGSTSVEPHALVDTITLIGGEQIRLFATTDTGTGSCASAQQFTNGGEMISAVSFCRGEAQTDLQPVNGALVGYIPDRSVASVKVTTSDGSVEAKVRHRFFLLQPETAPPGSTVTVVQYDRRGRQVRDEVVSVTG